MPSGAQQPENRRRLSSERSLKKSWVRFLQNSATIRHYIWKYRGYVAVGLLALVMTDILEIAPPWLLKLTVDIATGDRPVSLLKWAVIGYLGTAILQALGRYGWRMYLTRASMFSGRDIRKSFTEHLFGLSQSFFDRRPIGDLMSLATSDVEAVRMMLGAGLLTLADSIFYFMTVPVAMYLLSPKLTLIAFLPLPIIPWLVMRNERAIHQRYGEVQEQFSQISAMTQESLNGIRVLKAFAQEGPQTHRFKKECDEFLRLNLRLARVQSSFGPTLDFAMSLGMVLLLYFGGRELIQNGDAAGALTLGTFVAFQRYIQKMVWPMAALGMALSTYQRSVTSAKRLDEVHQSKTDVPQDKNATVPQNFSPTGWKTDGRIELRNLSFRFPGTEKAVLQNLSLTIEPGERVAFVGSIGSGKSALLSLLPRLYPVGDGMLFVDGVDVNRWDLRELRKQVGYVSQDVFLFSETVLENLAYSLQDGTLNQVEEHTRLACVHSDILGLVDGYQTRVGERGVNLSGGQKQRLTIARAIVKEPSILILDDALSSVDVQTEEKIMQGLRSRPGRNTELVAAHRISTIQDAHRIIVLERGQIIQQGTHEQLVKDRNGLYRRFVEQQHLRDELESYVEALAPEVTS
ncbi:MAG: ABC transporter ATP-binding protein [Bdellovibrionia bacterium]